VISTIETGVRNKYVFEMEGEYVYYELHHLLADCFGDGYKPSGTVVTEVVGASLLKPSCLFVSRP
jgi:hypothetical protein